MMLLHDSIVGCLDVYWLQQHSEMEPQKERIWSKYKILKLLQQLSPKSSLYITIQKFLICHVFERTLLAH